MSNSPVETAGKALIDAIRESPPVSSYYTVVIKTSLVTALERALEAGAGGKCEWCDFPHLACQSLWADQKKCCPDCTHADRIPMPDWARLLLECRDALPAISLTSARLRGIDLALATRIEDMLKPWRAAADDPKAV